MRNYERKTLGKPGEEAAYILSGAVDLYLNETVFTLEEGDAVKIPPLTAHRWVNSFQTTAKIIFAVTPPTF